MYQLETGQNTIHPDCFSKFASFAQTCEDMHPQCCCYICQAGRVTDDIANRYWSFLVAGSSLLRFPAAK